MDFACTRAFFDKVKKVVRAAEDIPINSEIRESGQTGTSDINSDLVQVLRLGRMYSERIKRHRANCLAAVSYVAQLASGSPPGVKYVDLLSISKIIEEQSLAIAEALCTNFTDIEIVADLRSRLAFRGGPPAVGRRAPK